MSRQNPAKPYPDFPLTAHNNGQWCKKILGKVHFFGVWADPDSALKKYFAEREDLQAGRTPARLSDQRATTKLMVNGFLQRCQERVSTGDLSALSYADYVAIGQLIVEHLGRTSDPTRLRPIDFAKFRRAIEADYSPARLGKTITVTRMIFRWAYESELIATLPRFGPDFKSASKKSKRIRRAKSGAKLITAAQFHQLLEVANPQWRAILLLCLNGGLGNSDVARVRSSDLAGEWLTLPRGKTGVGRRIPLWPETLHAIAALNRGPGELLFQSTTGQPLIRVRADGKRTDLTIEGFRRVAQAAGIYKPRLGLYWIRHTFQTVGEESGDPVATSAIMGHIDSTMAGQYRERISDSRLLAVTAHVRRWWLITPAPA